MGWSMILIMIGSWAASSSSIWVRYRSINSIYSSWRNRYLF